MSVLPEDVKAEQALLGSILLEGREVLVMALTLLRSADFTRDLHRRVFAAMERLHGRGLAIDRASVAGEMCGDDETDGIDHTPELLDLILEVPTSVNAGTYAQQVRRCATARRVIGVSSEIARLGFQREDEAGLMADVQRAFDGLLDSQAGGTTILTPKSLAERHFEVLDRRQQNDPAYIGTPTGYSELDKIVAYRAGELWYIAASPGIGKTGFMTNLQDSLSRRGVASLFASAEQPAVQLMDRALAAEAGIDSWKIARGDLSLDEWRRINDVLNDRLTRPAYIYDDPSMTTARLAAVCQLAKARYGIKVVFVDYVQLLADESKESEYARISNISRRLAHIARSLGLCVVAACQVSRQGAQTDGQIPRLADLRGSGGLEQDAFVVLGIGRKPNDPATVVRVNKNRNGRSGIDIPLYFDAEHVRFVSVAREAA